MVKKKILVSPLNWGLGHATRCIPIIKALEGANFEPILASDGDALGLLKKEFPHLLALELPSYDIEYAKKGKNFKWKLITQLPKIVNSISKERKTVDSWINKYSISGIISDNRLGVHSKKVPSVFITHQLRVLTGNTSWLTTKLHHIYINKYNECWVPDTDGAPNLSGKLGHLDIPFEHVRYIGPLSRLHKKITPIKYQLMVILSGPEPQRTLLEEKLILELKKYDKPVLFINGRIESEQQVEIVDNITFYNYMDSEQLELAFNESEKILCRSGYTTIMDLAHLGKKAFFIPTPGQYEQEYLARKLKTERIAPSCHQDSFKIERLDSIDLYKGLNTVPTNISWKTLFRLF